MLGLAYSSGILLILVPIAGTPTVLLILIVRLLQSGLRYGLFAYLSHPFVEPGDPMNSFSNSLDFATRGTMTHGGGVHVLHHHRPGHHWTMLNAERRNRGTQYGEHASIVFPFEMVPYVQPLVFGKRFDVLAAWVLSPVDVAEYENDRQSKPWSPHRPQHRIIQMLERRSRPDTWRHPGALVSAVDGIAARAMLWAAGAERFFSSTIDSKVNSNSMREKYP